MPEYSVVVEAIVEQEKSDLVEVEDNKLPSNEKDETPKMGSSMIDSTFLFIGLIVISLIGIANAKNYIKRKEATN
ncbi:MAG: hypothetical protein IJE68_06145 [Clostridia bacterium]|nr:hypothetical protein [Clostridia bacterium]